LGARLEAGDRVRRQQARIRRKISNRVVAPLVDQAALDQMTVVDRSVYWEQLNCGHPEIEQVVDHRWRGEASKGTAVQGIDIGMSKCGASDRKCEDDRL